MTQTKKKIMTAMVTKGYGGFEKLELRQDVPVPQIDKYEVLIEVRACGLNNTDINTRTGWYSRSVTGATNGASFDDTDEIHGWGDSSVAFPRIQGADVAGVVIDVGSEVDASLIGQRVMVDTWLRDWTDPHNKYKTGYFGSECDGGFAKFTKVDYRNVHPITCSYSDEELATFATSYVTAENMLGRANVDRNDTILITGASGGVGSALVQLAKRRGAEIIAMCSSAKHEQILALGADRVIDGRGENLEAMLQTIADSHRVSVVADVVGGKRFGGLLEVLQRGGRYVCAGAIAGPIVEFDLRTFYLNDLILVGATIVPVGVFADLVGYIAREEIKPVLAATYPLAQLVEAQEAFLAKKHVGNIVVTL